MVMLRAYVATLLLPAVLAAQGAADPYQTRTSQCHPQPPGGRSIAGARTDTGIDIAIQPAPDLGVRAIGESNDGQVRVGIDGGSPVAIPAAATFRTTQAFQTDGYEAKRIRVEIRASSGPGNVNIASVPNAPLKRQ